MSPCRKSVWAYLIDMLADLPAESWEAVLSADIVAKAAALLEKATGDVMRHLLAHRSGHYIEEELPFPSSRGCAGSDHKFSRQFAIRDDAWNFWKKSVI